MVLFTSRSSLTWGNLQVLHLASLPGIYPLSTLNNQFLMSLQRLHNDRICILCQKGIEVGEGCDVTMGKSQHLPPPDLPGTPVSFLWRTTFHQQPKDLGGGHPETLQWHGLSPSLHRRCFRGSELWHIPGMDKSHSSLGLHLGGGSRDTVCLHLQWTQLALCPCAAIWGLHPYTPSQGQAFRCSLPGIGGGEPLWVD